MNGGARARMLYASRMRRSARLPSALLAALLAAPAAAGPYEKLSREVVLIAKRSGYARVAVLPFNSVGGADGASGRALAEQLVSRLAGNSGLQVVERALLDRVLGEQSLGHKGMLDQRQAKKVGRILGVDAIVTGSYLNLSGRRLEVHTRLIDTETARILGAATARVDREWDEDWSAPGEVFRVRPPELGGFSLAFAPAPAAGFGEGFAQDELLDAPGPLAGGAGECDAWEARSRRAHETTLDLKARFWAARMREPGFSARALTRNPGSEIRDLALRQELYRRIKELYQAGGGPGLTTRERESLLAAERKAEALAEACY